MVVLLSFLRVCLTLPIICIAQVIPTAPGPGQIFTAGSECIIKWRTDTTGTWNSFDIDLMSGSNQNMSRVTNVVAGLDGTSTTSYSWICPSVHPYAAIYFYQFNQNHVSTNASHAWTTRFAIASESGVTTFPEQSRQPNGDPIPWGIGKLTLGHAEQSEAHTGTLHRPSDTPATAEQALSTSHSRSSEAETATLPDVTLDVPAPKPIRNSRRDVFKTVYVGGNYANNPFPTTRAFSS